MIIKKALNDREYAVYTKFSEEHKGQSMVILTPTNIATNIKVQCTVCGESKDITDYSQW